MFLWSPCIRKNIYCKRLIKRAEIRMYCIHDFQRYNKIINRLYRYKTLISVYGFIQVYGFIPVYRHTSLYRNTGLYRLILVYTGYIGL